MHDPKMIVMGLIRQGLGYGLEMEGFIEKTRMRLWARIGGSTIYKTLRDLKAEGFVTSRRAEAARGPGKTLFKLTPEGNRALRQMVEAALRSDAPFYSDRIAGMFFALPLGDPTMKSILGEVAEKLEHMASDHDVLLEEQDRDAVAGIILDFYRKVYLAESEALRAMAAFMAERDRPLS